MTHSITTHRILVLGAGYAGMMAAIRAARRTRRHGGKVTLVNPSPRFTERLRLHQVAAGQKLDDHRLVDVVAGKVLPDAVERADGELVACDACVWTVGVRVSPLASEGGITTDERGRIMTDATLRSISHPSVYAIGDAAAVRQPYGVIHGTCQSGMPTGVHAADSIGRGLRGKQPRPFRFGYIHQPVSLGRGDAVIQFTRPDDTPRRARLTGRRAVAYKEFVSSSPIKTCGLIKRFAIPGAILWTRGGRSNRLPA